MSIGVLQEASVDLLVVFFTANALPLKSFLRLAADDNASDVPGSIFS